MAGERLILTGFMGVGKSAVSRDLASLLGVSRYDTDDWMETESGLDVPTLVKTDMPRFRRLEADTLLHLLGLEPAAISTGGGIVSTEVGRGVLLGAGVPVIWLQAPFETSVERVAYDTGRERPLFNDIDSARALHAERQPWYAETCHFAVDATQPAKLIATDIISHL